MILSSFMRQVNLAITALVSNVDADFRRRLATDFSPSLANAERMPLPDIARALLPVYERWLMQARSVQSE